MNAAMAGTSRKSYTRCMVRVKASLVSLCSNVASNSVVMTPVPRTDGVCIKSSPPRGDGVAIIKRRHQDLLREGVRDPATALERGQLKEDLESSMWRRRYNFKDDDVAWWVDSGATVHMCKDRCWFKTYESLNDGSILHMGHNSTALMHGRGCVDLGFSSRRLFPCLMTESRVLGAVVRLPDPKLKTLGKRGIECIFVGYAEHSKDFRFYVIEPNESVSINSIIESKDAIFDENRLSLALDQVSGFLMELNTLVDDPKIFDETMKSHDVAFWKKAINNEMDSIMGNNT
ncbi:hypothetical protein Tco_0597753 [Tanacetum coccineum]